MNTRKVTSLVSILGVVIALTAPGVAFADPPPEPGAQMDISGIRDRMAVEGVPEATQDALIDKLLAGETWDSLSDAEPVDVSMSVDDGYNVQRLTYADGSMTINKVEIPSAAPEPGTIGPMSVDSCAYGQGVGRFPFWDCHVATNQFLVAIDYYADGFTGSGLPTWAASITTIHDIGYWTGAATVNSYGFTYPRHVESSIGPAKATATLYVTFLIGSGSGTYKLSFYVQGSSMWDTSP